VTRNFVLVALVVDDDIATARALFRLLRSYGHRVEVAHSAHEGFARACELRPDVILHDVAMPSMDGYAAARRLRQVAALDRTVLIACSGLLDEAKAREAGFDGWLHKPISPGELETVLALATERLRARRDEPAE
jgi:CheY-like chemotaxis protein